jgi:uncharacterized protein (DUF488 family)
MSPAVQLGRRLQLTYRCGSRADAASVTNFNPGPCLMEDIACHSHGCPRTILTIGHSTRTLAEFIALVRESRIELLVDVRSMPRSRTNPQFNIDVLPEALGAAWIGYRHLSALGGLRHRRKGAGPSPNTLWRNASFRNYADYAATDAFRVGLEELEALARDKHCVIMCAEAVWWSCHRRIIADYLLAGGISVAHIMGHDKIVPAKLTPGVRLQTGGALVYPAAEEGPLPLT